MMLIGLSCMFPGGNEEAQSIKIVESIMNETSKDYSSGEMLLKILTAEKDRLAKVVLEEGSTSRKGVNMVGIHSGGATKSVIETLSNDNSVQKSQVHRPHISYRFVSRLT